MPVFFNNAGQRAALQRGWDNISRGRSQPSSFPRGTQSSNLTQKRMKNTLIVPQLILVGNNTQTCEEINHEIDNQITNILKEEPVNQIHSIEVTTMTTTRMGLMDKSPESITEIYIIIHRERGDLLSKVNEYLLDKLRREAQELKGRVNALNNPFNDTDY